MAFHRPTSTLRSIRAHTGTGDYPPTTHGTETSYVPFTVHRSDGFEQVSRSLLASSLLYVSGGLFWSLDWRPDREVLFAFVEADWPQTPSGPVFNRILWPASMFMVLVALMLLPFLWTQLP